MRNKLTRDEPTLFIDQYGYKYRASSLKELCAEVCPYGGRPHVAKQYTDKQGGGVVWNGYVVNHHWLTAFKWAEVAQ